MKIIEKIVKKIARKIINKITNKIIKKFIRKVLKKIIKKNITEIAIFCLENDLRKHVFIKEKIRKNRHFSSFFAHFSGFSENRKIFTSTIFFRIFHRGHL